VAVGVPSGTVTFLFTDIEESTRLWDERPDSMRPALARHDELLRSSIVRHGGHVFSVAGDGLAAAFQRSGDAVAAAVDAQVALAAEPWPAGAALRVRMGIHSGEAEERDGNYYGAPLNRAARLMAAAHGGQVVMSDVTAGLVVGAPGIGLVDLGVHRLRGLIEPARVFGVKADSFDWLDAPLATAEAARGNLPRPATEWFGSLESLSRRAAELERRRLVTLTGPGGVGKTRLAIEVAGLVAMDFPDGVWMVELASIADPGAVHAAIASTLGVLPQEGVGLVGAIVAWLEGRRLLLILDNCEHVLAPVVALVTAIVQACPTITVVTTSREPLGVDGERVAPVPSLGELDAVELFCDRAAAVDDTVDFSSDDKQAIASICTRLDGIPLAIELAAARVRSLTPSDLLDRLADRFRVVRGGARGVERHQTLRATVDWSYRLLSEAEQHLFDRLSVFAGGFDLAAAEEVCADAAIDMLDVFDLLANLVDKSLVVVDRGAHTTRYGLLETLRQYGEEHLDNRGETEAVRRRHLGHYVVVANTASELWASPRTVEGVAAFNREWDNIRAALGTALDIGDLPQAAALLRATAMHAPYDMRYEYVEWAERTIARYEAPAQPGMRMYADAATVAWSAGEFERAIDLASSGLALIEPEPGPGAAVCLAMLALSYLFAGRIDDACAAVPALEAAVTDNTDPISDFQCFETLLVVATITNLSAVARYADQAIDAANRARSTALVAHCGWIEGMRLRSMDPPDLLGALACFRKGLAQARDAGLRREVVQNLMSIASVSVKLQLTTADAALAEAIACAYELRYWPTVWPVVCYAAGHLGATGRRYAAGTLAGYLGANLPNVVTLIERSAIAAGARFDEVNGPDAQQGMSNGALMDRSQVVSYVLSVLSTTDSLAAKRS
jgi:predicted ATPase/class 3 adenylate cyclase